MPAQSHFFNRIAGESSVPPDRQRVMFSDRQVAAPKSVLMPSLDPYAAIRTLDLVYRPPIFTGDRRNDLFSNMSRSSYTADWEALKPSGFQSKYNKVRDLGGGLFQVTLQQPGAHKYDTMEALYLFDPGTGLYQLQNDPMQAKSRQISSGQQFRDTLEEMLPWVAGIATLGYAAPYLIGATAGAGTTAGAAAGTTVTSGLKSYMVNLLGSELAGTIVSNALVQGGLGGISAELQGGNFMQGFRQGVLGGAVAAGVASFLSPSFGGLSQAASDAVNGGTFGRIVGNAVKGVGTSVFATALRGGNSQEILRSAGAGALGGGVNAGLAGLVGEIGLSAPALRLLAGSLTDAALGADGNAIIHRLASQGLGELFLHSQDLGAISSSSRDVASVMQAGVFHETVNGYLGDGDRGEDFFDFFDGVSGAGDDGLPVVSWAELIDSSWFADSPLGPVDFIGQQFESGGLSAGQESLSARIEITGNRESGISTAICLASVSVARAGTSTADGEKSLAGHMWYAVSCPGEIGNGWEAGPYSFGFSQKAGKPIGPGGVNVNGDDHAYYTSYVTHTFSIPVAVAEAMRGFGRDPFTGGAFSSFYNVLTNSCVDFVWKALEIGGLNKNGFQGALFPADNIGWLLSLDPVTGQFPLAPYDPSKVNPKTLLPRQEGLKNQRANSGVQADVSFFIRNSFGQILSSSVSSQVSLEAPTFDHPNSFMTVDSAYGAPFLPSGGSSEVTHFL